jgi:transcriptional regulator with XRE-family HTH domain
LIRSALDVNPGDQTFVLMTFLAPNVDYIDTGVRKVTRTPPMSDETFGASLTRNVGERVLRLRRRANLTQAALAGMIGVGRTSVTNLEAGRQMPPLSVLLRVSVALNVELRDLIPLREELQQGEPRTVPLELGGHAHNMSPKTAELVESFWKEKAQ